MVLEDKDDKILFKTQFYTQVKSQVLKKILQLQL